MTVKAASESGPSTIDGYIADSPYPSTFHVHFAPAWLDAILLWYGLRPPRAPRAPFSFVDLGCGDGAELILLAAAHPEGRFLGIDAMAAHVERGRALAAEIGLDNVELHCRGFAEAGDMPAGKADYVVSQGVLAWISPPNQAALLDLAARMLRPGGIFCVGYNSLPGWSRIAGFQRLVRALADEQVGNSRERFESALAQIRAGGMVPQAVLDWLQTDKLPPDYFAHEYLNRHWAPLWSGDVIAAAVERGLVFSGQSHPSRVRPDLTLRKTWREALAGIAETAAREIAADLYVDSFYRHDIYGKGELTPLADSEARSRRLQQVWASLRGTDVKYETRSPAGRVGFDNAAARAILVRLEDGPARLADLPDIGPADLLNTIDAMLLAGLVAPVDPAADVPRAAAVNRRLGGTLAGTSRNARVGAHGVAVVPLDLDPDTPEAARRLALPASDGLARPGSAE